MQILLGYIALALYFGIVFFGIGKCIKHWLGPTVSRKIIHILTGFSWFIYDAFFGCSIHQIIVCGAFLAVAIISRRFGLIKEIEDSENKSNGTIYYAVALFLIMTISYFFKEIYPYVGITVITLAVGDGGATLIGKYSKSKKIYHNKTLFGFLGCIGLTFFALSFYNLFYCHLFNTNQIALLSLIAGIFEEEDFDGLDNISVAFSSFTSCLLFKYVSEIELSLVIFIVLFFICFFLKVMTYRGSIISAFLGASFFYIGGFTVCLYLTALYLLIIAIHLIKKVKKVKRDNIVKKHGKKDAIQVLANGFVSLIFIYLFLIFSEKLLLVISLISFSNSFVDSLASDIGSMSKKKPYDIFKRKFVEPGTSGGMSILGTTSAFVASIIFGISIYVIVPTKPLVILIGVISMNLCCFVDTVLGSTLQVKYKCEVCGLVTEKEVCCDHKLKTYSGYKFFNNDSVNFLCSCLSGISSLLVFLI